MMKSRIFVWVAACVSAVPCFMPVVLAAEQQRYIVILEDPPATRFDKMEQVVQAKALGLSPTSTLATGHKRFDAKASGSKAYADYLYAKQNTVIDLAKQQLKRELPIRHRYEWITNGFAVDLTAGEAAQIAKLPGIAGVQADYLLQLMTDASPQFIGAEAVWNGTVPGSALQSKGENIVVGIVDTGINAAHPAFADVGADGFNHNNPRATRFGLCNVAGETRCNDKLIGIHDFVNEAESQPGADLHGHGTHVASTAAGNFYTPTNNLPDTLALNLSGVAPHANLIMYKACTADSVCEFSATAAALNQAIADNVDVINYSIGGFERNPWEGVGTPGSIDDAELFLNARAAGIVGVVSAGNSGPLPKRLSSPGNAPWVISVANISTNRNFIATLANVSGFGIDTPLQFTGASLTSALNNKLIVHAKDFGDADCGKEGSEGLTPTGASNPFPLGTFNGQIVICERGFYARVEKSFNVKASGASGMILVNTLLEGESTIADEHYLPTVHLGKTAGDQLEALVEAAWLGGGQISGEISAAERVLGADGDRLNVLSSRGPNKTYDGVLKPNLAAPGTNILAASKTEDKYAILSGTSMASPHVAGAAALLLSAHPDWTVSQVESALLGTASDSIVLGDGITPASLNEAGAGRVMVSSAVRSALHLKTDINQFTLANPAFLALDTKQLNLSALHTAHCQETCIFTRTVTDNGNGGNWQVLTETAEGALITVNPSSFTLAPNQSQVLEITIDVQAPAAIGKWIEGAVRLRASGVPDFVMPISVFYDPGSVPEAFTIETNTAGGSTTLNLSGLTALPDATFRDSPYSIVTPKSLMRVPELFFPSKTSNVQDEQIPIPIDIPLYFEWLSRPEGTGDKGKIYVEITTPPPALPSDLLELQLIIGRDSNNNGLTLPIENEELCVTPLASSFEYVWRCVVDTDWSTPGVRYWVQVDNLFGNPVAETKLVFLNVLDSSDADADTGIVVSGPRHVPKDTDIPIQIGWNLPELKVGDVALAFLRVGSDRSNVGAIGNIPLQIKRTASSDPAPLVLDGKGDEVELSLEPGQAHERMVIDVPPNATSVTISTSGQGEVDLYFAKATAAPTPPVFAPAPARLQAQGSSIHPGATESITLNSPALSAGRWYVTPVNAGASHANFTLSVAMTMGSVITQPGDNVYYNPERSGHGIYLSKAEGVWFGIWYTYEEDGKPTWYTMSGEPPTANAGVWSAPLARFSWNGATSGNGSSYNIVGKVILTFDGTGGFTYSWLLNGEFGSEPFYPIAPLACVPGEAGPLSIGGNWYAPDNSGWGTGTFTFAGGVESTSLYVYDALGNPRWLLSQDSYAPSAQFPVAQFQGFCPTCTFAPLQSTVVGTLTRSYLNGQTASHAINANFANGVPGSWNVDKSTGKLTRDIPCSN